MRLAELSMSLETLPVISPYRAEQTTRFTGGHDLKVESYEILFLKYFVI